MASVLTLSDKYEEVIPPVVKGAAGIIAAAVKEPSIKPFVYISSSSAALMPQLDMKTESKPAAFDLYSAAKIEAEMAIWSAVEKHKPQFQVATVLPTSADTTTTMSTWARSFTLSSRSTVPRLLGLSSLHVATPLSLQVMVPRWFVNVQDTARLHVFTLLDLECNGERILAFAVPFNGNDVLAALQKLYPDYKFWNDMPGQGKDITEVPTEDAEKSLQKHYNRGFPGLEETLKEVYADITF
ncbi:hypothetical protein LTR27_004717 [Elasticomyces elasticus]|nr:hypothetical protein LTR27_004717 [Elasticomyces elasticus]